MCKSNQHQSLLFRKYCNILLRENDLHDIATFYMEIFTALDILQFHFLKWLISFLTNFYCLGGIAKFHLQINLDQIELLVYSVRIKRRLCFHLRNQLTKQNKKHFNIHCFTCFDIYVIYFLSTGRPKKSYPFQIY